MKSRHRIYNLGLTGYPLSHSLSPRLHQAALHAAGLTGEYRLYPIPPTQEDNQELARLLEDVKAGRLHGLNVTIPHKRTVLGWMDELTPTARATGAVNTIYVEAGKLAGDNTDVQGFRHDLRAHLPPGMSAGQALVIGAGGSARAVVYALLLDGWQVAVAARRVKQASRLVEDLNANVGRQKDPMLSAVELDRSSLAGLAELSLVVNCTPLGMAPDIHDSPWPAGLHLPPRAFVYDLVYNPNGTALVRMARQQGRRAANGLGMLVEQAALSFERWTGLPAPRRAMLEAVRAEMAPPG